MSGDRRGGGAAMELVAFGALAGFSAFHWANLLRDPPVARVVAVVAIAVATAAALDRLRRGGGEWRSAVPLAAVVVTTGLAAGLLAAGVPGRLLAPGSWGELRDGIGEGITGLGGATYPYRAGAEWPRLVLLAALPAMLGIAAAVGFWPAGPHQRLRAVALGALLVVYGAAAVLYAPGHPGLHGAVLLALVAAWLWGSRAGEARGRAVVGLVLAAGALALPLSSAIARSEPVVDYRSWSWTGGEPTVSFEWNHSYDPLGWPREGTPLLEIESEVPHYWRSVVLERFDGFRWVRSNLAGTSLELPTKVEGELSLDHPEWFETTGVTVRELRSDLIVGPGSVQNVDGLSGSIAADGTVLAGEVPDTGQSYEVTSYAPDPTAAQLEEADGPYPPTLARFTTLELPSSLPFTTESVEVPLRGAPAGQAPRAIERSGYGPVHRLARRLTRDAPTSYDAVVAVEQHFRSGFVYSEEAAAGDRPLRSFLLETRTGYCQQYSGAMALMLRLAGIPARVVSGFSPGAPDRDEDGVFTVRDTDAHSWVEVYFNDIGWVPFDPTPSASPAELQSDPAAAAATPGRSPDRPGGRAREPEAGGALEGPSSSGDGDFVLLVPAALLAATAIAAAAATLRRRARFGAAPRPARLEAQVEELAGALTAARYRAGGGATLLALERRLRDGGRRATAGYLRDLRLCLYSAAPRVQPGLRERRAVRRELSGTRGLVDRLRLLAALPPGGPRVPAARRG